jgi:hypothetical protein
VKLISLAVLVSGALLGTLGCNAPAATSQPSPTLAASIAATPSAAPTAAPTATPTASPTLAVLPSPPPSATPAPSSSATSLTGQWSGSWTNSPDFGTPPANGGLVVVFQQTGNAFTGDATISGSTCDTGGPSSGTIAGNQITFGFQSDPQRPVTFEGTIDGDTMSGTWNAIACAPANIPIYGTWELTRDGTASPTP